MHLDVMMEKTSCWYKEWKEKNEPTFTMCCSSTLIYFNWNFVLKLLLPWKSLVIMCSCRWCDIFGSAMILKVPLVHWGGFQIFLWVFIWISSCFFILMIPLVINVFLMHVWLFWSSFDPDTGASWCDQCSHGENGDSHLRSVFLLASCSFGLAG